MAAAPPPPLDVAGLGITRVNALGTAGVAWGPNRPRLPAVQTLCHPNGSEERSSQSAYLSFSTRLHLAIARHDLQTPAADLETAFLTPSSPPESRGTTRSTLRTAPGCPLPYVSERGTLAKESPSFRG